MVHRYNIEVDCANCARKMEDTINDTDGVRSATVNFMTQKLVIEFEDGIDPNLLMPELQKKCKRVERDCEIFF